jgi:predicted Zn-dependent protease
MEGMLAAVEATMTVTVAPEVPLDADKSRRLESPRYVAGGKTPAPSDDAAQLKDIKDMLPTKQLAARLRRGMATGTMDDAEVLEVARQLVRQSPETASFRQHLGETLVRADKLGKAIEHLAEAVQLDPTSADAHYHLGDALARLRKHDEPTSHLAQAL